MPCWLGLLVAIWHTPRTVHRMCEDHDCSTQIHGTHDRHVPSQWQATATTREHNLADRPGSIDRIDLLRPTSGDHKTFFLLP